MFDGATEIVGGLVADFSRDSRGADVAQHDASAADLRVCGGR
jgi:hypothetical protein